VEGQTPKWKRKESVPPVTKSFHEYCVREVLQNMAATVLQVSDGPYDEVRNIPRPEYCSRVYVMCI